MSNIITLDYEGMAVDFTGEAWFNATAVAKRFGRLPNEWLRLPETISYLDGLERKYGKIPHFKTSRGRGGGTWMHPRLGVAFARWLDVDFAIWCDEQVNRLLRGESLAKFKSDRPEMIGSVMGYIQRKIPKGIAKQRALFPVFHHGFCAVSGGVCALYWSFLT